VKLSNKKSEGEERPIDRGVGYFDQNSEEGRRVVDKEGRSDF